MTPGRRTPLAARVCVCTLALAGTVACDAETAEFLREFEAARGDCTMDAMRASSEECVQMFERYADISSEAINTYIGGMRALDEALRRSGGLSLDTAGLGRAFSDEFLPGYSGQEQPFAPGWYDQSAYGASAPYPNEFYGNPSRAFSQLPDPGSDPRMSDEFGAELPPVSPRGALLPPEARLRRPWIGSEPDDRYASPDPRWESEGYVNQPGYGVTPGYGAYGTAPAYGPTPGYGTPWYGVPGYGGGYPGYGGSPGIGVYPGNGGYSGYDRVPGYGYAPGYGGIPGYGVAPPRYPGVDPYRDRDARDLRRVQPLDPRNDRYDDRYDDRDYDRPSRDYDP